MARAERGARKKTSLIKSETEDFVRRWICSIHIKIQKLGEYAISVIDEKHLADGIFLDFAKDVLVYDANARFQSLFSFVLDSDPFDVSESQKRVIAYLRTYRRFVEDTFNLL